MPQTRDEPSVATWLAEVPGSRSNYSTKHSLAKATSSVALRLCVLETVEDFTQSRRVLVCRVARLGSSLAYASGYENAQRQYLRVGVRIVLLEKPISTQLEELDRRAMNKAFIREPEQDGRAFCPSCGSLGVVVSRTTLDHHILSDSRSKMGVDAWFCPFPECDTAYFDLFERIILVAELRHPVYPKSLDAAICPCFGFMIDDLDSAVRCRSPERIRELLAKSRSPEANCSTLAANGRCCMQEVQRLYIRGVGATK